MSSRSGALRKVMGLGLKFAPLAYEGLKHGRDLLSSGEAKVAPANGASRSTGRSVGRRTARAYAMEHAAHLVDGSVLPVYEGDHRVWVVFSGDSPVATHPVTTTPVEELLTHADLGRRIRPTSGRRLGRGGRTTGTGWPSSS